MSCSMIHVVAEEGYLLVKQIDMYILILVVNPMNAIVSVCIWMLLNLNLQVITLNVWEI